jgi:protein-S-isoprenylcysteine O-methyltransferase Ste14
MRAKKRSNKRSNLPKASAALAVANHAAMGIALGLVFALILVWTPFYGVLALINLSDDPSATMETFVGTVVLMFGIGAALTGFILTMEDI